jgi:hypothetical protein
MWNADGLPAVVDGVKGKRPAAVAIATLDPAPHRRPGGDCGNACAFLYRE